MAEAESSIVAGRGTPGSRQPPWSEEAEISVLSAMLIDGDAVARAVEMVDADLGITFLPELARDSLILKNTRVRMKPLEENAYRTIGLAWRKGTDREEEFRMLGEFLAEGR